MLPQSLADAAAALESDQVVCGALGPALVGQCLSLLRDEALAYARHVSAWDFERYVTR